MYEANSSALKTDLSILAVIYAHNTAHTPWEPSDNILKVPVWTVEVLFFLDALVSLVDAAG